MKIIVNDDFDFLYRKFKKYKKDQDLLEFIAWLIENNYYRPEFNVYKFRIQKISNKQKINERKGNIMDLMFFINHPRE